MAIKIRTQSGLYLHKNGGFTDKKNAVILKTKRGEKIVSSLDKKGIKAEIVKANNDSASL